MIRRTVKVQLLVFAVLTLVGVSYVGARYAGIGQLVMDRRYAVNADFAESGGIFSNAEVTYRGVTVGRVGALTLHDDGIRVELLIDPGTKVPADARAVVANRSAVGEQYVDLQPRSDAGPYLRDGSTISRERTKTPIDTNTLLVNLDRLVNSVGKRDLATVIDELGKGFYDSGRNLQRLIDNGNLLTDAAVDALPETIRLIDDGRTVLKTQNDQASAIKSFAHDLADLSGTLRSSDSDLRRVLDGGAAASGQLRGLLEENRDALPVLLGNLVTLNSITVARLPGLEQILVTYPASVSAAFTVVPGDGTAHFGLVTNADEPPACRAGYGSTNRRAPSDTDDDVRANDSARCAESDTDFRGAQNSPGPRSGGADRASYGGDPAAGGRAVVAGYDPRTGAVATPGGRRLTLGSHGGQQRVFGKDSWQWLLYGPLSA